MVGRITGDDFYNSVANFVDRNFVPYCKIALVTTVVAWFCIKCLIKCHEKLKERTKVKTFPKNKHVSGDDICRSQEKKAKLILPFLSDDSGDVSDLTKKVFFNYDDDSDETNSDYETSSDCETSYKGELELDEPPPPEFDSQQKTWLYLEKVCENIININETNYDSVKSQIKEIFEIMVNMLLNRKLLCESLLKSSETKKKYKLIANSKIPNELFYRCSFLLYYFMKKDILSQDFVMNKFSKLIEKINVNGLVSNIKNFTERDYLFSGYREKCADYIYNDLIISNFTFENLTFSEDLINKIGPPFMSIFSRVKFLKKLFCQKDYDDIENVLGFKVINSEDVHIVTKGSILFWWIRMSKVSFNDELKDFVQVESNSSYDLSYHNFEGCLNDGLDYLIEENKEKGNFLFDFQKYRKNIIENSNEIHKDFCFLEKALNYLIEENKEGHFLFDFQKHSNEVLKDYVSFFKWLKRTNKCDGFPKLYSRLDDLLKEAENELHTDKRRFSPEVLEEKEKISFYLNSENDLGFRKFEVRMFNKILNVGFFVHV